MDRGILLRSGRCAVILGVLLFCSAPWAEEGYGLTTWLEDVKVTRWETGAAFAGATALGLYSWNWGSSNDFTWNPEGWFGEDTGSGGADKLGHAFTSYALTNVFAERLLRQGRTPQRAGLSAFLTAEAVMLYVEVFDGYSEDHGFAWEDLVMNTLGAGLGYARTVSPRLRDLVDYRLEYWASGYKGYRPLSDYSGQTYLLALKLGGFEALRPTALRYLELQTGYYTRGFSEAEQADGVARSRHGFVGVGVNLSELLLGPRKTAESQTKIFGRLFLEHVQLPHTAVRSEREL